jgi:hypothetical protein
VRLTRWVLVGVVGVSGAWGIAWAQPGAAPAPADVEVGAQRDVQLTPLQMVAEAEKYLPEMDKAAAGVKRSLQEARAQRDVVKVLCLTDKLSQIEIANRTSRDRMTSLRSAASEADGDRAKHEFTVLRVLRDRVRTLVAEANQCIGEETGFVGESRVTVDIDPDMPWDDPSDFPPDDFDSNPPVLSSPFL